MFPLLYGVVTTATLTCFKPPGQELAVWAILLQVPIKYSAHSTQAQKPMSIFLLKYYQVPVSLFLSFTEVIFMKHLRRKMYHVRTK